MSPLPSNAPFEVHLYSEDKFVAVICEKTFAERNFLERKPHIDYFKNYFSYKDIDAKSFVVETGYIDHDFLDDYVVYYSKCFNSYPRKCTRLHFFSIELTFESFSSVLEGRNDDLLNRIKESYLGFIVLKPLPKKVFGRTCLKTYNSDGERRCYLSINTNRANLFGIELSVDSLPFQEQDSVVAACATSSLWSAFKATGKLFQHHIPSPSEITHAATISSPTENRFFPNVEGLTIAQMAAGIRHVGLEPLALRIDDEYIFKSTIYAYVKCGIPVILIFQIIDTSKKTGDQVLGWHAVAVSGYSLDMKSYRPMPINDIWLKANSVDKIYAHDDQVGPFSRLIIDRAQYTYIDVENNRQYNLFSLTTTWPSFDGSKDKVKAVNNRFLIPIYNKVRIPFQSVFNTLRILDSVLMSLDFNLSKLFVPQLIWDVYLTTVNKYRTNILSDKRLPPDDLCSTLTKYYPKYLWIASVEHLNTLLCEILFDATDIDQCGSVVSIVFYDENFYSLMLSLADIERSYPYDVCEQLFSIINYMKNESKNYNP